MVFSINGGSGKLLVFNGNIATMDYVGVPSFQETTIFMVKLKYEKARRDTHMCTLHQQKADTLHTCMHPYTPTYRHTGIQQTYSKHAANIQQTYSKHTANIQQTYGKHTANIQTYITIHNHTSIHAYIHTYIKYIYIHIHTHIHI